MRIVGHGVDIVSVQRIAQMRAQHADRFIERCFTPAEWDYARDKRREGEHLAARFAAKEAVLKALGTGLTDGISWTDIEVTRSPDGRPGVRLSGRALEIATRLGIDAWHLSLSHADSLAIASVIATAPQ